MQHKVQGIIHIFHFIDNKNLYNWYILKDLNKINNNHHIYHIYYRLDNIQYDIFHILQHSNILNNYQHKEHIIDYHFSSIKYKNQLNIHHILSKMNNLYSYQDRPYISFFRGKNLLYIENILVLHILNIQQDITHIYQQKRSNHRNTTYIYGSNLTIYIHHNWDHKSNKLNYLLINQNPNYSLYIVHLYIKYRSQGIPHIHHQSSTSTPTCMKNSFLTD